MKTQRDRQWELIQQLLSNDLSSATAPKFTSQRTLFGIKSSTEEVLDRVVAEENQRIEQQLRSVQHTRDKRAQDASVQNASTQNESATHDTRDTYNQSDKKTPDEL